MLDLRLVPWPAVALGVVVASVFALAAFFTWRRRFLALNLITAAPVAGWFAAVWKLQGFPNFPPGDAPHWAMWFSAAGIIMSGFGIWKPKCLGCVGAFTRMLYLPALWFLVFMPVFKFDSATIGWKILSFMLIAAGIMALWHRKAGRWPAAEYAPWLVALTAASICLSLTGTASIGMMALALCFAAMPAAAVMLIDNLRKHHLVPEADTVLDAETTSKTDRVEPSLPRLKTRWSRTGEPQGFTLPLAFAFPAMVVSGPLYAFTSWGVACLLLASPVCGFIALRATAWYMRHHLAKLPTKKSHWKHELIAIGIALLAAAVPAALAVIPVMKAAAEEPYY